MGCQEWRHNNNRQAALVDVTLFRQLLEPEQSYCQSDMHRKHAEWPPDALAKIASRQSRGTGATRGQWRSTAPPTGGCAPAEGEQDPSTAPRVQVHPPTSALPVTERPRRPCTAAQSRPRNRDPTRLHHRVASAGTVDSGLPDRAGSRHQPRPGQDILRTLARRGAGLPGRYGALVVVQPRSAT